MSSLLSALKSLVLADKPAVVGAILAALGLLAARFGLKLNASDTAYVGTLLTVGLGLLVQGKIHLAAKAKAKPVAPVAPVAPVSPAAPVVVPPPVVPVPDGPKAAS